MSTNHPMTCYIPHDDRINLNIHKNMFSNLHDVLTSENWFSGKYIEAEIKNKLDKTRGQFSSDEM